MLIEQNKYDNYILTIIKPTIWIDQNSTHLRI